MDKQLKNKAIDIKGKEYVMVKDRVTYFNETYDSGSIETEAYYEPATKTWWVKAEVYPDCNNRNRRFTGYSQAVTGSNYINKEAPLENAETSAVGRALAFMGIGVIDSIASGDEMVKAGATQRKGYINLGEAQELKELYEEALAAGKITADEMKQTLKAHKADKWTGLKDNRYEPLKKVLQGLL